MKETYVKIVGKNRTEDWPDTYCPIDLETHQIIVGLSLIGFVPEGAEIVGEYNEDTNKLCVKNQHGESENNPVKNFLKERNHELDSVPAKDRRKQK